MPLRPAPRVKGELAAPVKDKELGFFNVVPLVSDLREGETTYGRSLNRPNSRQGKLVVSGEARVEAVPFSTQEDHTFLEGAASCLTPALAPSGDRQTSWTGLGFAVVWFGCCRHRGLGWRNPRNQRSRKDH